MKMAKAINKAINGVCFLIQSLLPHSVHHAVMLHTRSNQKRGVAECRLSFKSGRSGSKIGPYSQLRSQFAGRRQSARPVAPIAGAINVRCELPLRRAL